MNSNNRCIRQALQVFRARKYSRLTRNTQTGSSACMLALRPGVDHKMKRSINYLCLLAMLSSALAALAADQTLDSVQAQAKLAEVRSRIAALTNRLHDELKERDARSA